MTAPSRDLSQWRKSLCIRRSARARSVRLKVHPGARVELVLPPGFSTEQVPAILDRNEAWVLRQLEKLGIEPGPCVAPQQLQLPAINEFWHIDYIAGDNGRYGCRVKGQGQLQVSGGYHWQQGLKRWLARKGRKHLIPLLERLSEEIALPFTGATVRGQKTRWGSCSSQKHINLNYALLFLPPRLVHYLFVHELCHTRHMNHSVRFWRLVESIEPDYRELDKQLRQAARQLPAWLHASVIAPAG